MRETQQGTCGKSAHLFNKPGCLLCIDATSLVAHMKLYGSISLYACKYNYPKGGQCDINLHFEVTLLHIL